MQITHERWSALFGKTITIALFCLFSEASEPYRDESGRILSVYDGDTVKVLVDGKKYVVRIYGIDCPELEQSMGLRASQFMEYFIGKDVIFRPYNIDRYGRVVAEIIFDGKNVGRFMVKCGLAWHFSQYCDDESYVKAQITAKAQRRGIWQDPSPVPPWDYRGKKQVGCRTEILVAESDRMSDSGLGSYNSGHYTSGSQCKPDLDMTREVHVRGHWRTLSNGKEVWVRKHTRSRPYSKKGKD